MPVQTQKSGFLAELAHQLPGLAKRVAETPIDWGRGQDPPPGIRNGIAQLVECKFDIYKSGDQLKGKAYWRASGVIIAPKSVIVDGDEKPAANLHTTLQIPLIDRKDNSGKVTATAVDQLYAAVDEMRKLIYPEEIDPKLLMTEQGLTILCEMVNACGPRGPDGKPTGPYFYFSTSKRSSREYIDPKTKEKKKSAEGVWQNWHGRKGLEQYTGPGTDGTSGTEDYSGDQTGGGMTDEIEYAADPSNADGALDDFTGDAEGGDVPHVGDSPATEQYDLDALAQAADNKDGEAQSRLKDLAESLGVATGAFEAAPDWASVAQLIRSVGQTTTTAVMAQQAPTPPQPPPGVPQVAAQPPAATTANGSRKEPPPTGIPQKGDLRRVEVSRVNPQTQAVTKGFMKVEVVTVDLKTGLCTVQGATTKAPMLDNEKKPIRYRFDQLLPVG